MPNTRSAGKSRVYDLGTRLLAVFLALAGVWYFLKGFKPTINYGGVPRAEAWFALICFVLVVPMWRRRRSGTARRS